MGGLEWSCLCTVYGVENEVVELQNTVLATNEMGQHKNGKFVALLEPQTMRFCEAKPPTEDQYEMSASWWSWSWNANPSLCILLPHSQKQTAIKTFFQKDDDIAY